MDLQVFNLLEEKIKELLRLITDLRNENQKLKSELEESASVETFLDNEKCQQIRDKINGLLGLLEGY